MSTSMRIEALRVLAQTIGGRIPELADSICPWPTPPNHKLKFPSLAIIPVSWTYYPDQAEEVAFDPDPDTALMNVGRHEAIIQLRLAHASPVPRAVLEEKILDIFLSTPFHPGVLLTPVDAVPRRGEWNAAWELDDTEWHDENAFDQEFWSFIAITGIIPALVERAPAPRITDLRLALVPWGGQSTDPGTVTVRVNADGSLSTV